MGEGEGIGYPLSPLTKSGQVHGNTCISKVKETVCPQKFKAYN